MKILVGTIRYTVVGGWKTVRIMAFKHTNKFDPNIAQIHCQIETTGFSWYIFILCKRLFGFGYNIYCCKCAVCSVYRRIFYRGGSATDL